MRYVVLLALGAVATLLEARPALAQATGSPSFSAPVRPFQHGELGGFVSFPQSGTGWEGEYRAVSNGLLDVGIRGGSFALGPGRTAILAGFEGRASVFRHGSVSPVDAALIFGLGGRLRRDDSRFSVPLGFSIGRRIAPNHAVSLMPYVQPTWLLEGGHGLATQSLLGLGLGTDLRLLSQLDLRFGIAFGEMRGVSLGVVWLH